MQLDAINRLIAGQVGTTVNLEFQHENGQVSRATLKRASVYGK
jgi:hypothetical protein